MVDDDTDVMAIYPYYFNPPLSADPFWDEDVEEEVFETRPEFQKAKEQIDQFFKRASEEYDANEYGWLSPEGKFYPVEWGHHTSWSDEYVENLHLPEYQESSDYLQKNKWVLLHNPMQGPALIHYNVDRLTKRQREWLYDYMMKRGRKKEALALWNDK